MSSILLTGFHQTNILISSLRVGEIDTDVCRYNNFKKSAYCIDMIDDYYAKNAYSADFFNQ